jgi:hypothetical protein
MLCSLPDQDGMMDSHTSDGGVLGEWRYSSMHSLTSALDGGEWSPSRPGRFTPRERAPGTHWIGGWVGVALIKLHMFPVLSIIKLPITLILNAK